MSYFLSEIWHKNVPSTDLKSRIKSWSLNSSPVPSLGFLCVPLIVRRNKDNFFSFGETCFSSYCILLTNKALSTSLILAVCRTLVTLTSYSASLTKESLWLSGSASKRGCFFVRRRFSYVPAGTASFSYIFPSLSKTLHKNSLKVSKSKENVNLF